MFDHHSQTARLMEGAADLGVTLSTIHADQFTRYAKLLEEWNERINLTRVVPEDYIALHFLDSLTAVKVRGIGHWVSGHGYPIPNAQYRTPKLLDVGTGAGLPGIPLKIAFPDIDVTLLDSTRKRLTFLDAVIAELGLTGIRTLHARAEEAGRDPAHRERYDIVAARAVTEMRALAEWLLPLTKPGGIAVAMKSAGAEEEIRGAGRAVKTLGGRIDRVERVIIPGTDIERMLVVLSKERKTSPRYPRPTAETKRAPL